MEILKKILEFYKKRYNGPELEEKFNKACEDLIQSGDIKKSDYMLFCIDNDIEPIIKKKSKSSSGGSSGDPCGHSVSYRGC